MSKSLQTKVRARVGKTNVIAKWREKKGDEINYEDFMSAVPVVAT